MAIDDKKVRHDHNAQIIFSRSLVCVRMGSLALSAIHSVNALPKLFLATLEFRRQGTRYAHKLKALGQRTLSFLLVVSGKPSVGHKFNVRTRHFECGNVFRRQITAKPLERRGAANKMHEPRLTDDVFLGLTGKVELYALDRDAFQFRLAIRKHMILYRMGGMIQG